MSAGAGGKGDMKPTSAYRNSIHFGIVSAVASMLLSTLALFAAQQPASTNARPSAGVSAKAFDSPQQAADALVAAADNFDVGVLEQIFGSDGKDLILSGEYADDRRVASEFA